MQRGSGGGSQRHAGKTEQCFGRGWIRLRPKIVEERAVRGNELIQLRRELGHRLNMVHA